MTERRVRFTATALGHVAREQQWWLANRDYGDLFATELEEAVRWVALMPGAGSLYPNAGVAGLRRLYLPKIGCHIYYTHDDDQVVIRALWGSRRERGPQM
ncbi:MAG: type II toxin-antitoxin system RelE/ParE family toxin [Acidobacteriota bacterium]